MALAETVLIVHPDGTAASVPWPETDEARRAVITAEVGPHTRMRRCGKGILGFAGDAGTGPNGATANDFAAAAYAEQGVELEGELHGPVLFARNPSKGSVVKPLTAAQAANLLVVTGARLV